MHQGLFLVIEGTDGSGKGTQFKLLAENLKKRGYNVATFSFPQYEEPSSFFVQEYLNGKYGSSTQVNPFTASLFYALDRYQASFKIKQALSEGKVVLADRFTASNMGHQGQKFANQSDRKAYYKWLYNIEFDTLKIPKPDKNIILRVPAEIAQKMVDKKDARSYTTKKRDIHEADLNHLQRAVAVYDELCDIYPDDFNRIECVKNNILLSINSIQNILKEKITPMLPPKPSKIIKTDNLSKNEYLDKTAKGLFITKAGYKKLQNDITNVTDNVYAFKSTTSPVTAAAAMARLSRRFDDMRITILDEFSDGKQENEEVLKRVITAYGDDSVQQLLGQHIVVEGASNLLTKKLEWGRLAAYLEQSTRYIYYDQKNTEGKYKYHVPRNLGKKLTSEYTQTMNKIFDKYSVMVHKVTDYVRLKSTTPTKEQDGAWIAATRAQACDVVRYVLPVATQSTVGIYASGQAIESLIMRLLADNLPEARTTGNKILTESRKVISSFLERADKPERGGANIAYMAEKKQKVQILSDKYLPNNYADKTEEVVLTDVWPRNELDVVADMLYETSDLPLQTIRDEVTKWSYDQKIAVFDAYFGERLNRRQKPGRALEKIHYSWDIVCDYGIFRDLQRHRMVDDLEWQILSPRHGYETPSLIEEIGLEELFTECFDLSLQLYSTMQSAKKPLEAQYAVLLGHKMRWKITYNAREAFHLHELRTVPQGHPGYRKLVGAMHQKLLNTHPLIGQAMKFVNQDEDPSLTRLSAERYTQYKLKYLDKIN